MKMRGDEKERRRSVSVSVRIRGREHISVVHVSMPSCFRGQGSKRVTFI